MLRIRKNFVRRSVEKGSRDHSSLVVMPSHSETNSVVSGLMNIGKDDADTFCVVRDRLARPVKLRTLFMDTLNILTCAASSGIGTTFSKCLFQIYLANVDARKRLHT